MYLPCCSGKSNCRLGIKLGDQRRCILRVGTGKTLGAQLKRWFCDLATVCSCRGGEAAKKMGR